MFSLDRHFCFLLAGIHGRFQADKTTEQSTMESFGQTLASRLHTRGVAGVLRSRWRTQCQLSLRSLPGRLCCCT